jgi:hypothetical protein
MRFFILLFCLVFLGAQVAQAQTSAQSPAQQKAMAKLLQAPLFEPALEYSEIPRLEDCEDRTLRPPKYHECRDSAAIYAKAFANAKAKNQPLMVIFGFDTCPSCAAMDKVVFNSKRPMTNNHLVRYLSRPALNQYVGGGKPLTISFVYIHSRSKHGLKLADDLGVTKMAKDRGWHRVWSPFILFVDPQTGDMHSESYWEAKSVFCDWGAEFATGIEAIGYAAAGKPYIERKRCKA